MLDRIQIESALKESEDRFSGVFEISSIGMALVSLEGRWLKVNRSLCEIVGYSGEEMLTKTFQDLTRPNDLDGKMKLVEKLVSGEIPYFHTENRYLHKDGHVVWVFLSVFLVRDSKGAPLYLVSQIQDITGRKKAEEILLESEKLAAIGQLSAGVAHEINNPVSYVYSNTAMLQKYVSALLSLIEVYEKTENLWTVRIAEEITDFKKKIKFNHLKTDIYNLLVESRQGLAKVTSIVQALRDYTRGTPNELEYFDLRGGIDSALTLAHSEIASKARVEKEYCDIPAVQCVPAQVNQVFMNVLMNAAQSIAGNGVIYVKTFPHEDGVTVEVADTGCGVAPEAIKHLFDPFFTTRPVGKGAGLGLYVSYNIVKKHRGSITVESEVGKGTTVRIWLPVNQEKGR
ncbi:MAG: PAS domain S-box protein [Nitrospinae bacterium]|nr:PAS domain S-box protein [Nitrospinota bacterium]